MDHVDGRNYFEFRLSASSGAVSGVPASNLAMGKAIAATDSPGSTGPQHDGRMLSESASQQRGRRTTCGVPEYTLNGAGWSAWNERQRAKSSCPGHARQTASESGDEGNATIASRVVWWWRGPLPAVHAHSIDRFWGETTARRMWPLMTGCS